MWLIDFIETNLINIAATIFVIATIIMLIVNSRKSNIVSYTNDELVSPKNYSEDGTHEMIITDSMWVTKLNRD